MSLTESHGFELTGTDEPESVRLLRCEISNPARQVAPWESNVKHLSFSVLSLRNCVNGARLMRNGSREDVVAISRALNCTTHHLGRNRLC